MDKPNILIVSFLIVASLTCNIFAQILNNESASKHNRFLRLSSNAANKALNTDYYPNNIGDFWEYIVKDTTTLFNQFYALNFSITREVLSDSLMSNGRTYKQIKWENIANSVDYFPWYEYQRVDSTGSVFIYYDNKDFLLFDFNLAVGQTYTAHISNHSWKINDKYNVIGFGDTVVATDFELYESGTILKEIYTVAEKFGIIYYVKNINEYAIPAGNFWGAVLSGTTYGRMIAKKQTVDWSEFYPLHVGDYWIYEGQSGSIPTVSSKRIILDTVLSDGNLYYKSFNIEHTFGYTSYAYERIDSLGRIFHWDYWNNEFYNNVTLSVILGDTITAKDLPNSVWRMDYKIDSLLKRFLYPDLIFNGEYYTKGIGLSEWTIEGGWGVIKGASINGTLIGDTTLTSIKDVVIKELNFKLYQNYPNPFNSETFIRFFIDRTSYVSIIVYDILGNEVKNLVDKVCSVGTYNVSFNAQNISNGIYFYVFRAEGYSICKKLILLK